MTDWHIYLLDFLLLDFFGFFFFLFSTDHKSCTISIVLLLLLAAYDIQKNCHSLSILFLLSVTTLLLRLSYVLPRGRLPSSLCLLQSFGFFFHTSTFLVPSHRRSSADDLSSSRRDVGVLHKRVWMAWCACVRR